MPTDEARRRPERVTLPLGRSGGTALRLVLGSVRPAPRDVEFSAHVVHGRHDRERRCDVLSRDRKVYPYEEKFATSDFSHAIQMVVSTGMEGRILMEDAYGITETVRRATEGDLSQEATDPDALRCLD